jgi:uncharacterized protein (TIGR04255 family)
MDNAPLIEIIAELRWAGGRIGQPPSITFGGDDSFYVRLGIAVGKDSYDRLDRIQPEGMPTQAGAVVYRYRRGDAQQNTLYQAGPGIFTANGLPPYNSWAEFEPVIRNGLTALWGVNAFNPAEPVGLVLRYVDAFTGSHLNGMSKQRFVESVVGVGYTPTSVIAKKFAGKTEPRTMRFHAVHEAENGEKVIVDVGNGLKDGEEVLVLNTSAISHEFVAESVDHVMGIFGDLQQILHDIFFEMLDRTPELRDRLIKKAEE